MLYLYNELEKGADDILTLTFLRLERFYLFHGVNCVFLCLPLEKKTTFRQICRKPCKNLHKQFHLDQHKENRIFMISIESQILFSLYL